MISILKQIQPYNFLKLKCKDNFLLFRAITYKKNF